MELSEELDRLGNLRQSGVLSEDEFVRAKARVLGDEQRPLLHGLNVLRRSRNERWIGGVCGGIAAATGTDAWMWRLIFALLFFAGAAGLVVYLLLWFFVPPA